MAMLAEIGTQSENRFNRRRDERQPVALQIDGMVHAHCGKALIHNLSRTGFLLEADCPLSVGQHLQICLPVEGDVGATVTRVEGKFAGSRFDRRITKAAISAAKLQSTFDQLSQFSPTTTPLPEWNLESGATIEDRPTSLALVITILMAMTVVVLGFLAVISVGPN